MTVTGKIQKYKMREMAVEELKLQIGSQHQDSLSRRGVEPARLASRNAAAQHA